MFWLSDTAQRMQIIQAYSSSKLLEDLGQAFAMAILYIAFTKWVIPIIHLVIDFCKFAMIDPFLSWFQTEMLSREHRAAEKTNRLQIRSELEYLRKEEDFKLHQWKSHKDTLLDLVRDLRKEVSDGEKLVSEARERATQRKVEIDSLKAQLQANIDYKDNYEHYKAVVGTINFGFYAGQVANLANYTKLALQDPVLDELFAKIAPNMLPAVNAGDLDALSKNSEAATNLLIYAMRTEQRAQERLEAYNDLVQKLPEMTEWTHYMHRSNVDPEGTASTAMELMNKRTTSNDSKAITLSRGRVSGTSGDVVKI